MSKQFDVQWRDAGREPKCAPNPDYPSGIDIYCDADKKCRAELPYPAKRCGLYEVRCNTCGASIALTTAGRADDPRSVELPCKRKLQ